MLSTVHTYGWMSKIGMLLSVTLVSVLAGAIAAVDRSEALIGYSEIQHRHSRCEDKHEQCREWQQAGQCLVNPYYMRVNCPDSCQTPACFGYQPSLRPWSGYATDYQTRQYHTR